MFAEECRAVPTAAAGLAEPTKPFFRTMRGIAPLLLLATVCITAGEAVLVDHPTIVFNSVDFATVANAGGGADAGEPSEGTAGHATHPTAGVAAALVLLVIGISTVSPRPARAALAAREADAAEKRAAVCAAVVVSRGGVVTAVAMQGAADAALHSLLQEPGVESAFVVEEAPPCSPST